MPRMSHHHITCLLSRKYCVCCLGESNARVRNDVCVIENIDDQISKRKCIDSSINKYGKSLLHFLLDNSKCILIGTFEYNSNKYISVTIRGYAVTEYLYYSK